MYERITVMVTSDFWESKEESLPNGYFIREYLWHVAQRYSLIA